MNMIRVFATYLVWLFLWCGMASPVLAAQCSDVFGAPNGVNSNLQASGNTLDLSGVPFANNPWPASGTTLSAGDYYFRSTTLGNGYRLNVDNGAQVRIFVNGSLTTGNNVDINPNRDNDQLLLVVDGNFSTGNNAEIRGLAYASGAISLGNNADVRGGLAAGGSISTGNRSPVADDSGVDAGLLEGLCESGPSGPVELSANGDFVGPVEAEVGVDVLFAGAVSDCPGVPGFYTQQWRETWRIDGNLVAQSTLGSSSCSRSPVERTDSFDAEGVYDVALQVEYRNCLFGFFCGGWETHGEDSIVIEVFEDDPLTCFEDEYVGGALSADDWVTSVSSGSFTPGVVNGRLRMTEAVSNQATAATLQREIPGAENLVILEFDYYAYGGSGADGIAIVLSDSAITPQPGSFGGSLGYAQRRGGNQGPGFAGGWMGVGLDEFGNFSNATEGREGGVGSVPQAVVIRGSGSGLDGYKYLAGTAGLSPGVDATGSGNPHRYRITVDSRDAGAATVSVERDTGSGMVPLIAPFNILADSDQDPVPENFLLSLTGSTGGSTNIHELDNVELCALKLNPVGEQVDHFEIRHDGVALTCQPETVTLRACANPSCDELFTDPVQATLAPTDGWQGPGGNVVSLAGGTGQATLANTVAGIVELDVVGSQPSTRPQARTLCQIGAGNLSEANCRLESFDSGLAFNVPDLTSHRPSGPIEVRAVRRDDASQECVPAFENVERPVRFWSTYVDPGPNGRPVSRALSVDGSEVSGDGNNPTVLDLDFGTDGIAEIEVRYPDAGRMQLSGTYIGSVATNDEGLVMPGSDPFVSVPAGLCVRTGGECAAGDASCPLFVKAEEDFNLSITAVGWQSDGDSDLCEGNPVTPNFRLLDIPLSSEVVAPSGGDDGVVSPSSYSHTRSADATETVGANVSEVGVFRFQANPDTGTYLGLTVPGGSSEPTGRFYPDRFEVTVSPGELEAKCTVATPFTYIGEDMEWRLVPSLTIEPVSVEGNRTLNYTESGFQRLSTAGITRTVPATDSNVSNLDGSPMAVTVVLEDGTLIGGVPGPGLLRFDYDSDDIVSYDKVPEARVPPFGPALEYIVTGIVDSDGVSGAGAPYLFTPVANFDVRYGRLSMENVYGPENINELLMPFRVEYWNGSRFEVNTADSCTGWNTGNIGGTADHHALASGSGMFSAGEAGPLRLQPAGSQGTDTLIWDVADWLTDDFNGDGSLEDPSALATFGVYRGHDRVIYWQEK